MDGQDRTKKALLVPLRQSPIANRQSPIANRAVHVQGLVGVFAGVVRGLTAPTRVQTGAMNCALGRSHDGIQDHCALFHHMTVFENAAFGLRVKPRKERPSEETIRAKGHELLDWVQLGWLSELQLQQMLQSKSRELACDSCAVWRAAAAHRARAYQRGASTCTAKASATPM